MQPPLGLPPSMLHRRNLSLDSATASPTSPLSRAGSTHGQFRSPLSQLRRYNESLVDDASAEAGPARTDIDGGLGERNKPLPLTPFEPVVFRTPYRNRSVKVRPSLAKIALVESIASPLQGQIASLSEDLENWSRAATVLGETAGVSDGSTPSDSASATARPPLSPNTSVTTAPLSRVWSNPDIQWPAARPPPVEGTFSQIPPSSQPVSRPLTPLGAPYQPAQPFSSPPPPFQPYDTTVPAYSRPRSVAHLGHVIAPTPITPVSPPRLLPARGRPVHSPTPSAAELSTPSSRRVSTESQTSSSLHRTKAISRRPSPVHIAREQAQQEFETANSPWAGLKVVSPTSSMDKAGSSHSSLRAQGQPQQAMPSGRLGPHLLSEPLTQVSSPSTRPSFHSLRRASDTERIARPRPSGSPRAYTSPALSMAGSSESYASDSGWSDRHTPRYAARVPTFPQSAYPAPRRSSWSPNSLTAGRPPPISWAPRCWSPNTAPPPGTHQTAPTNPTRLSSRWPPSSTHDPSSVGMWEAACQAATYLHVLLRASAFAQHMQDLPVKSATISSMLASLHFHTDDPQKLHALGRALNVDNVVSDVTGASLLERLLAHFATQPGFHTLFTTSFAVRTTCSGCADDAIVEVRSWSPPHVWGDSVCVVRNVPSWCQTCSAITQHIVRSVPLIHGPLLLIEPGGSSYSGGSRTRHVDEEKTRTTYTIQPRMRDIRAGKEWTFVGAVIPLADGQLGFVVELNGVVTLFQGRHRLPIDLGRAVPTPVFVLYEQ